MAATFTLTVPKEYGYVLLTATSTIFLGVWHGLRIGGFRRAAQIPYPIPYAFTNGTSADIANANTAAEKDVARKRYLFNCAQRAHGNFLENFPLFFPSLLIAGLRWPVASSIMGLVWGAGRLAYAIGYTTEAKDNGSGRLFGVPYFFMQLGLFGMVGYMAYEMITA